MKNELLMTEEEVQMEYDNIPPYNSNLDLLDSNSDRVWHTTDSGECIGCSFFMENGSRKIYYLKGDRRLVRLQRIENESVEVIMQIFDKDDNLLGKKEEIKKYIKTK